MRPSRLTALLVLALASPLAGQAPVAVAGRVVDAGSGAPVVSARVELGGASATTGMDGRFRLGNVPAGMATLVVTAIGYRPGRQPLDLLPGMDAGVNIRLEALTPVMPTLVVQGAGEPGATMDHEALVQRGSDLAGALDGWQGVVIRRSGGNGPASPQVRGSAPEEVVVLVDGFAINDPLTGRADLSRVATRDVASVQLRAGAQSAGGAGVAIGGVIDVRSQVSGNGEASGWIGGYGSAGGTVSATVAGARLFLRGERLADAFTYTVPANRGGGEGIRRNAGGTIGALSFRTSGRVVVQGRASLSERGMPGSVGNETPHAEARDGAAFLGASFGTSSRWSGSLQYLQSTVRDSTPPFGLPYSAQSTGWSATLDWSLGHAVRLGGWHGSAEVGAAARRDQYSGDVVRDGTQFSRGGVRASATVQPSGSTPWRLTPSVRLDSWTGESAPLGSARLDAGWRRGATALHFAVGSAVSAPPLADLFFREGVGVALNPGLRPERVRYEIEVGVDQEWSLFGAPGTATVHGYYGRVDDMILWAPGVGFIWSPRNFDVIRRGVDAAVDLHPASTMTLSLQGAWTPITYDVPGGAQVQYRPVGTWGASMAWATGTWGADVRWHWVGERYPNSGGANPRPAFGIMDVGVERSFGTAVMRAGVRDLFDSRAEFLAGYPTPGRTAIVSVSMEWQ